MSDKKAFSRGIKNGGGKWVVPVRATHVVQKIYKKQGKKMFYLSRGIVIVLVAYLFFSSCRIEDIEKNENLAVTNLKQQGIRFEDLSEEKNQENGSITFTGKVISDKPIKTVSLWGEVEGSFERIELKEIDVLGEEMILNSGFENFSIDIATEWSIWTSLSTAAIFKSDIGYIGSSQHILVSKVGLWGLYLFQKPEFVRDKKYRLSFWYKTSDANSLYIEIGGDHINESIYKKEIKGTSEKWEKVIYDFYSNEGDIKQARIGTDNVHEFWIDELSVREIINETEEFQIDFNFEASLNENITRWYVVASDTTNTKKSFILNCNQKGKIDFALSSQRKITDVD